MLVLTRKAARGTVGGRTSIRIGPDILIHVLETDGPRVKLGIVAPAGMTISRDELAPLDLTPREVLEVPCQ